MSVSAGEADLLKKDLPDNLKIEFKSTPRACPPSARLYSIAVALARVRTLLLERERHTEWVKALLLGGAK